MRFLFESIVTLGLFVLLYILVRKRKAQLKDIENVVRSKFNREGWSIVFSSIENGAKFTLYNRREKFVLVVFTKNFNFDIFKRSVIIALLNRAERIEVYHSMTNSHVRKAVNYFNKNGKLHKTKLIDFEGEIS
ncbi:hypothetical protein [Pseudothermotoga sp.]|nr:hypothetical protein [Pseudothermotoga sp.]MCX7812301.1 hypothetical protein [Pseudothermotoga sp.]MDW8139371.1 hypothetical protein [Pseudothermotoga sp.]